MAHKKKYSDELKIEVGNMYESGMSAKQIAVSLKIPNWLAFYLSYQGRKLTGKLKSPRPFKARVNGHHSHVKRTTSIPEVVLPVQEVKEDMKMFATKQVITPIEEPQKDMPKVDNTFRADDFVTNNVEPVPSNGKVMKYDIIVAGLTFLAVALMYNYFF